MRPLGNPIREYGFAWPELFREVFLFGGIIMVVLIAFITGDSPAMVESVVPTLLLGWLIFFLATGIYFSRRPKIVVYENGIGIKDRDDEKAWNWNQITRWDGQRTTQRVNGIPMFKYGSNNFYAGDEKIFVVGSHRACADQLAGLLILKMAQTNGVPRDYTAFQDGKTIQYNGVKINKNGLGGNKQSVRWDEIEKMDFKGDNLRVKRNTDRKLRKFGYVSPVASYYLMGLLDRVRGTDFIERKTAELSRSRGQIWGAQGKRLALITLIIAPILVGLIWLMSTADQSGQQRYSGLRQINAQFGTDIGIACTGGQYDTYAHGDSQITKQKFLVIDSTDNNNPHISDDFQTALPLKQQAASGEDLTTVVCVWEDPYLVGQCSYGDVTRKRYRNDYVVSLIEVERKTIVTEDYLPGTKPPSCPKTDPGYDLHGSLPSSAAFTTWLRLAGQPSGNSL